MKDPKKQYEKTKERILKSKISDLEKSSQLTNNWLNYIQESISEETKKQNSFNWHEHLNRKMA